MRTIFLLGLFVALAVLSLILVSAINQYQAKRTLISRKIHQLKLRVSELDELATAVDTLVESPEIASLINDEALDMIDAMLKAEPENQPLQVLQHTLAGKRDEFANLERDRALYRIRDSDAAIAKTLYMLNEAGRILRKRQASGKLEVAEMEVFVGELAWAHLLVGVVSYISQGQKLQRRGDVLRAHAFYKKAQDIALNTSTNDDRKHKLIREINDLTHNRIQQLSREFMPEAHNVNGDTKPLKDKVSGF